MATTEERLRRTRLANMRQELTAPAGAILGYADILVEEARRGAFEDFTADLDRIARSARELLNLVERLLDEEGEAAQATPDELAATQARLRHDLRNPLTAIKGYAELLLEELESMGGEPLRRDLEVLLSEAERLLSQIDHIVDFFAGERGADGEDAGRSGGMISDFVRAFEPLDRDAARPRETGRVLVIDDNESNRSLLVRRLQRGGHEASSASSGREALARLATDEVDLILLDLLMPDVNGYEVLAELKADARLRAVPVIIISGLTEMDGIIRCIEAGAEDYLPKPINPVLLDARIGACLERKRWRDRERAYLDQLSAEKDKSEGLLLNILPEQIVTRLKEGETVIADRFETVTVLFADLVGFTRISARIPPARLVEDLNRLFSAFDALAQELGVEKVKTIGDAYMAAAGLPELRRDHVAAAAELALGMRDCVDRLGQTSDLPWKIRIGMHCGPVIAGIIGTHKFIYDVWGDTVNQASRFESTGKPDHIHISASVAEALADTYDVTARGRTQLPGKGMVDSYFLLGRK